ncbi:MAG: O-antigen ligase family protein, partial [SAR324 cluster bacterium]|nr:O-antigen ligase family protein [SAR324 cluster bacterium]
ASIFMVVLTQTRVSIVALAAGAVMFLSIRGGRARLQTLAITAGVMAFGGAIFVVAVRMGIIDIRRYLVSSVVIDGTLLPGSSVVSRLSIWRSSIDMYLSSPIVGVGPGQWNWAKYDVGSRFAVLLDAHNGYLHTLAEVGVVGLAMMLFLVGVAVWRFVHALRLRGERPAIGDAAAVGFLVWGMTELMNAGVNKAMMLPTMLIMLFVAVMPSDENDAQEVAT